MQAKRKQNRRRDAVPGLDIHDSTFTVAEGGYNHLSVSDALVAFICSE